MMTTPNIVVIMTDEQRADVCASEGFPLDTTPFLDSLAGEGTRFNRAYTPIPLCSPARVSMLTGRFPSAHRVRENRGLGSAVFEQDLFDVTRARGYSTAIIGKNHSHVTADRLDHYVEFSHRGGSGENRSSEEIAFDAWMAELGIHRIGTEPTPFPVECQSPFRAVSEAQHWIDSLHNTPFCLWLSFPEPHNPFQVPDPYFSMFEPDALPPVNVGADILRQKGFKWEYLRELGEKAYGNFDDLIPRARANYFGMLRLLDDQIRRLVEFLRSRALDSNTILVFTSDHGDYVGEYGLLRKGVGMPETLMRVPLFFVGPAIRARETSHDAHVSLVDVFPTLCEAIGTDSPTGVQGRSLWPLLTDGDYPDEEFASIYGELGVGGLHYTRADAQDTWPGLSRDPSRPGFDSLNACTQSGTTRMVRRADWKLILDMHGHGELYHLASDPWETKNLFNAPEHLTMQAQLLADMAAWMMRAEDPLPIPANGLDRKTDPRNYLAPYR